MGRRESEPLVSFVVPLFNKSPYILETLSSIDACTYRNREVIVVDDCSTDGSDTIAEEFCASRDWILIRHKENQGLSLSRNTGLEAARGDYLQFWDADDVYDPDGLAKVVTEIEEDGSDFATAVAVRSGDVLPRHRDAMRSERGTTFRETPECLSAMSSCFKLYRREFLEKKGITFVPKLYMQDVELNIRAAAQADRITMTPYVLGEYRKVAGSWSKSYNWDRVRSAARIEELSRGVFDENGLSDMHEWREKKILHEILDPFIDRTLDFALSPNPDPSAWECLNKLRDAVIRCSSGQRALAVENPSRALVWACLSHGLVHWALEVAGGRIPDGLEGMLAAAEPPTWTSRR